MAPSSSLRARAFRPRSLLPLVTLATLAATIAWAPLGRGSKSLFLLPGLNSGAAAVGRVSVEPAPYLEPEIGPTPEASSVQPAAAALICGASLAALKGLGLFERDVGMCGPAPKKKRSRHKTRRARILWYSKGDRAAKRALQLAQGIKDGTVNFIYGKPEDEDDYDDDYDDEDFDDDDDDELSKKSLS